MYDKVRQSVTSKSKSKKHGPITTSDLDRNGLIRACDLSMLSAVAFAVQHFDALCHNSTLCVVVPIIWPPPRQYPCTRTDIRPTVTSLPGLPDCSAPQWTSMKWRCRWRLRGRALAGSSPRWRSCSPPASHGYVHARDSSHLCWQGLTDVDRHVIQCILNLHFLNQPAAYDVPINRLPAMSLNHPESSFLEWKGMI